MARVLPHDMVDVIDTELPWAKDITHQMNLRANYRAKAREILPGILRLLEEVPEELLVLSSQQRCRLMLAQAALEEALNIARRSLMEFDWPRMNDGSDCVAVIREILAGCPDAAPSQSASELGFIPDERLRRILGIDLGSAERALNAGEWKIAMVLAGSIIEALLLWAIQQHDRSDRQNAMDRTRETKKLSKNLDVDDLTAREWDLHSYTELALVLEEIKERTANVCREARYYRSLIHAAVVERDKEQPSRGKAHSALGAVYSTVEDLQHRHGAAT